VIFCDKFHRKHVRWLTYLNKDIDYNVNRQKPHTPLIIFKEKENGNNIYSKRRFFTVGNHKHELKKTTS
jgi:hypothetical protein